MPPMEVNRGVFFLILLFFLLTPTGNPPRLMSGQERETLNRLVDLEEYQIQVVVNSTDVPPTYPGYKGYGNLTGLTSPYQHRPVQPYNGSIIPEIIYNKSLGIWNKEAEGDKVFIKNISATFRGQWQHIGEINLSPINMTLPNLIPEENLDDPFATARRTSNRTNVTIDPLTDTSGSHKVGNMSSMNSGNIHFSLLEHSNRTENYNISLVSMEMTLSDENYDQSNIIELKGVHWKETGNVLLSTNSLKYSGFYALPHFLLPSADQKAGDFKDRYNETRNEIIRSLNRTINIQLEDMYFGIYEEAEVLSEKCEYLVYGHIHSSGLSEKELNDIEDELRDPQGRPHKKLDNLKLDAILYSPDCGQAIVTLNVEGEKYEFFYGRMRVAVMCGIGLLLLQTVSMAMQMKDTVTPSTISKISFYSICMMALLDGSICMSSLVSSFLDEVALPFMAVAFVSFSLTSLFEMRYMVLIYRSQLLESVADARARQATSTGESAFVARADGTIQSATPAADESTTTLPQTEVPQISAPVELDEHQIMGMIYSRFYVTLLGSLLLTLTSNRWPKTARRIYEYIIVGILYSIWVPQIYRNVVRGTRKSFLWKFVISCSIIRYIPVLYFCLDTTNVLRHHYDPNLAIAIAGYLWFQVALLGAQYVFGPRFFLPKGLFTNLYDYHPILTEEDLESGFDISTDSAPIANPKDNKSDSGSESQPLVPSEGGEISVDCAICMNPVEIPLVPKDQVPWARNNPASMLARRRYMITPCRHVYHTECMEHWMRTRLQCPICRNPLPPI